MPDNHIITMLDEKAFSGLSDGDIARAESHIATCRQCRVAYEAARAAAFLIEARASETVNPGPFFKTRVMAAIRERRLTSEEPALVGIWRSASALISTLALLLAILTGVTIFSQSVDSPDQATEVAASQNFYSAEYVMLERGDVDDQELANDQVLGTMYDLEDADGQ